jgi:hypothetical protein
MYVRSGGGGVVVIDQTGVEEFPESISDCAFASVVKAAKPAIANGKNTSRHIFIGLSFSMSLP